MCIRFHWKHFQTWNETKKNFFFFLQKQNRFSHQLNLFIMLFARYYYIITYFIIINTLLTVVFTFYLIFFIFNFLFIFKNFFFFLIIFTFKHAMLLQIYCKFFFSIATFLLQLLIAETIVENESPPFLECVVCGLKLRLKTRRILMFWLQNRKAGSKRLFSTHMQH